MKTLISALFVLLLTACGFTPMYGSHSGAGGTSGSGGLNNVEIALIPDQSGVYLRNILVDNFYQNGYPSSPTHVLTIKKIDETETDLDITIDSEATRKQIRLGTIMTITDKETGVAVLGRTLTAVTSYNILGSQFTTRVSENDAREAALTDLARQIEMQTALYFNR